MMQVLGDSVPRMSEDLSLGWTVARSPREVYDAVLDVRGWWGADIVGSATAVGDVFEFEVPDTHWTRIEVARLEPGALVEWRVLANRMTFVRDQTEWVGSTIRFTISPADDGARLDFVHLGLTPSWECYENCAMGWDWYAARSLRQFVETGAGTPFVLDPA
jgi:hypothetical protein